MQTWKGDGKLRGQATRRPPSGFRRLAAFPSECWAPAGDGSPASTGWAERTWRASGCSRPRSAVALGPRSRSISSSSITSVASSRAAIASTLSRFVVRTCAGPVQGLGDHLADLLVHHAGPSAPSSCGSPARPPSAGSPGALLAQRHRPQRAHAVVAHHQLGDLRGLLQVVGGAGGHLADEELLRGAPAHHRGHLVAQLVVGHEVAVLERQGHGVAQRRQAAGDDGDLRHPLRVRQHPAHHRVAGLVVGDDLLLALVHPAVLLLQARHHPLDGLLEVRPGDVVAVAARGQQGRLVHHVGQVRAGEARRARGDGLEVHVRPQLHVAGVDLQHPLAARACPGGPPAPAGRSGPGASARCRGSPAGWWPRG